jgi:hypothetical protein
MKKIMSLLILLSALVSGCKKDDEQNLDPNAVTDDEIRLNVTITAPGIEPTDSYKVVGNFHQPNYYNPAGGMSLRKKEGNIYTIDIKTAEIVDSPSEMVFMIFRNATFPEVSETCQTIQDRRLPLAANKGKEVNITVPAFKGTGSCPP